jgi:hypothetical protein
METTNQTTVAPKTDSVDYAAALRQYSQYGRGRSMRKFCEDEGYDYWKFCKYARSGQAEMSVKTGGEAPGFIEVKPDGTSAPVLEEPVRVSGIRIRFSNGMILTHSGGDVDDVISAIRKILS